tara:strand:+ start:46 stop:891 length:846 start_codon:yes stop_codon:yes gene_type:complete
MDKITYNPGIINKIGKKILSLARFIMSENSFKNFMLYVHAIYKSLQRNKYLMYLLVKFIFLTGNDKKKYYYVYKLFPFTMGGSKALENAFEMTSYVDRNNIEGSIVECGVAEGGTSAMMALTNKNGGYNERNFYLFDSFEGLPNPSAEDFKNGKTGDFIRPLDEGDCLGKIEDVEKLFFDKFNFSKNKINLIKGWFQDTIPNFKLSEKIAILRLDGDWYDSTRIPLENFYHKISVGGVIIIDDYATCYGSKKAVDEFIMKKNIIINLKPDGRGGAWFIKEK